MNEYLKSASERYKKLSPKRFIINPISEVDCEIMVEIRELLKKAGLREADVILKEYKYLKDTEIRDQLMQCNINFRADEDSLNDLVKDTLKSGKENDELFKVYFLTIGEHNLFARYISGFIVKEDYDENDNFIGTIILNPVDESATKQPIYSNYKIVFRNEEKFENELQSFKKQMIEAGIDFAKDNLTEENGD